MKQVILALTATLGSLAAYSQISGGIPAGGLFTGAEIPKSATFLPSQESLELSFTGRALTPEQAVASGLPVVGKLFLTTRGSDGEPLGDAVETNLPAKGAGSFGLSASCSGGVCAVYVETGDGTVVSLPVSAVQKNNGRLTVLYEIACRGNCPREAMEVLSIVGPGGTTVSVDSHAVRTVGRDDWTTLPDTNP